MDILNLINQLPDEMQSEIKSFIIPNQENIIFKYNVKSINSSYSFEYKHGIKNNELIENKDGEFLSRIEKKNGKHRYYITKEIEEKIFGDEDEDEYEIYYKYESKYVGKNIEYALLHLFHV